MFSDAGRVEDHGELAYFSGLLIGPLAEGSLLYTLAWSSHKSKRTVKSIGEMEDRKPINERMFNITTPFNSSNFEWTCNGKSEGLVPIEMGTRFFQLFNVRIKDIQ